MSDGSYAENLAIAEHLAETGEVTPLQRKVVAARYVDLLEDVTRLRALVSFVEFLPAADEGDAEDLPEGAARDAEASGYGGELKFFCFCCGQERSEGHDDECPVGVALKATESLADHEVGLHHFQPIPGE